jgi:phosphohistidine phosphatase
MKKLFIVRHAKSDWGHEGLPDIDRPLNQRGYDDAHRLSTSFKLKHGVPDLMVSSSATRAISTAFIFARNFSYQEKKVEVVNEIYEANVAKLINLITGVDDKHNSLMLFGHNPGLTNLFNEICDAELDNLPTCGLVLIEFNVKNWKSVLEKKGKFIFSEFPKDFKA